MSINITFSIFDETMTLNLTEINFKINEKLIDSSPNIPETKNDNILDDFKDIFNPIGIRIIFISFWIIYVTLSNTFFALLILYEKYGEDTLKRSINNQLWSQAGLTMILHICVCSTIFMLRFMFGPLHFGVALFEVCFVNIYISWIYLALAEISVIKALLIFKFSWIVGIDENFTGRFLLKFNLGYSLISQTARLVHKLYSNTFFIKLTFPQNFLFNSRYFLGSFFDAVHFQLLTGIKFTIRPRLHGPIYLSIISVTCAITFAITNIKKMKETYKEWKFHQNININLNTQLPCEGQLQFNNVKNNFPLYNTRFVW
mgnify:CR=1 FL=1